MNEDGEARLTGPNWSEEYNYLETNPTKVRQEKWCTHTSSLREILLLIVLNAKKWVLTDKLNRGVYAPINCGVCFSLNGFQGKYTCIIRRDEMDNEEY